MSPGADLSDVRRYWIKWEEARREERAAAEELREKLRDAREAGYTLAQIAQVLGISRQRVMQLSQ